MPKFKVGHRYASSRDGVRFGPYQPGDTVEVSDAEAEWINRDSPGTLAPIEPEPEREAVPAADRQHRPAANRGRK